MYTPKIRYHIFVNGKYLKGYVSYERAMKDARRWANDMFEQRSILVRDIETGIMYKP